SATKYCALSEAIIILLQKETMIDVKYCVGDGFYSAMDSTSPTITKPTLCLPSLRLLPKPRLPPF
ncbi:MAG: hypothetical protein IKP34_05300, partial [Bacteroidales bacterium]|nr:hypothetical protein [Bacteroidales bacterium]